MITAKHESTSFASNNTRLVCLHQDMTLQALMQAIQSKITPCLNDKQVGDIYYWWPISNVDGNIEYRAWKLEDNEVVHMMFSIFTENPNIMYVELCGEIKPQSQCSLWDVMKKLLDKTMKPEWHYVEITITI